MKASAPGNASALLVKIGLALSLCCLWSCTNPGRDGLTPASNLSNAEVQDVRLTSNVTEDGYCIVRVFYVNRDYGLPVVSRLEGNVIEPVKGVSIATEPDYTHSNDYVFSIAGGLLAFVGLPSNMHNISFIDTQSGEARALGESGISLDVYQINEQSIRRETWRVAHFSGAHSLIAARYASNEEVTHIDVFDRIGTRHLEIDAYPFRAWLLNQDETDVLFLILGRPGADGSYEIMRLNDSDGNRNDVPKLEVVTFSPKFWQMKNPAGEQN